LLAIAGTTILNGSGGSGLIIGMALLLLLAVATGHLVRERQWERSGAAYSEELRWDVLGSSTLVIAGILSLALLIPTTIPSAIANLFWPNVELPSGIAAIDRQVQRSSVQPTVEVGLSQLPAVELGLSLEQAAPETLVLRIKTGEPLPSGPWPRYWRARVLTRYTGRQWGADARVAPFAAPLTVSTNLPPEVIVQEVENLRANQELLLALPNVLGLDTVVNGERLPDGALAALTSERPLGRYRAFSLLPELAEPLNQGAVPPPDLSATLALPQNFSARVRDLAQTVAGQEPTPLAKALTLETYLRELPYSYTVRPLPDEGEAVDQFLFEMREGYCTYYASAMVTMARSLNIPARMAIGYATGNYDSALQGYLVREGDAHAWPELLIDGRWLPFEPTPVRPLPNRNPGNATPAPLIEPAEEPAQAGFEWGRLVWPSLVVIVTLGLVVGGGVLVQQRRKGPLAQAQLAIEQVGTRAQLPWPAGATLHEYARLIEERNGAEVQPLRELVLLIARIRYGNAPLDAAQIQRLQQARLALEVWARQGRHHR
jgi:transglutaminase-like putative cysteine protease